MSGGTAHGGFDDDAVRMTAGLIRDLDQARADLAAERTRLRDTESQRDTAWQLADDLRADLAAAQDREARVRALIDPEAEMGHPIYGSRYFDEADIRRALDDTDGGAG